MRAKQHVVFDIKAEKYRYLHREADSIKKRVNIDVLNKRLNTIKRLNTYSNAKMIIVSLSIIIIFAVISIKF
jgi:hypothetical protein